MPSSKRSSGFWITFLHHSTTLCKTEFLHVHNRLAPKLLQFFPPSQDLRTHPPGPYPPSQHSTCPILDECTTRQHSASGGIARQALQILLAETTLPGPSREPWDSAGLRGESIFRTYNRKIYDDLPCPNNDPTTQTAESLHFVASLIQRSFLGKFIF